MTNWEKCSEKIVALQESHIALVEKLNNELNSLKKEDTEKRKQLNSWIGDLATQVNKVRVDRTKSVDDHSYWKAFLKIVLNVQGTVDSINLQVDMSF